MEGQVSRIPGCGLYEGGLDQGRLGGGAEAQGENGGEVLLEGLDGGGQDGRGVARQVDGGEIQYVVGGGGERG